MVQSTADVSGTSGTYVDGGLWNNVPYRELSSDISTTLALRLEVDRPSPVHSTSAMLQKAAKQGIFGTGESQVLRHYQSHIVTLDSRGLDLIDFSPSDDVLETGGSVTECGHLEMPDLDRGLTMPLLDSRCGTCVARPRSIWVKVPLDANYRQRGNGLGRKVCGHLRRLQINSQMLILATAAGQRPTLVLPQSRTSQRVEQVQGLRARASRPGRGPFPLADSSLPQSAQTVRSSRVSS
jgi:hypothetical protein